MSAQQRCLCSHSGHIGEFFMRLFLVAATAWPLLCASPAFAQVGDALADPLSPMPSLDATSPLGIGAGGSVGPTGVPLGATELMSTGVSPLPTGVTGTIAIPTNGAITGGGTPCSSVGTLPSGMYGSTATYDGGGTAAGTAVPATAATTGSPVTTGTATPDAMAMPGMSPSPGMSTSSGMMDTSGMSGTCGSGSSSLAASSAPTSTSPTTPGGAARTGIPFGSFEIGNLGVSSAPAVPLPGALPIAGTIAPIPLAPAMPTVLPVTSPATTSSNPACASPGTNSGIGSFAGEGNAGITGTSNAARLERQSILCQRP